jgi:hypothetical protein
MAVARETELYLPVKNFFAKRGYEVKSEIRGCDLMAVHPDEPVPTIVELKKTFTLPLLLQGIDRQKTGAVVWLAVERSRARRGAHNQRYFELAELCRRLGLGMLTVTFYKTREPAVDVWCHPADWQTPRYNAEAAAEESAAGSGIAEPSRAYDARLGRRAARMLKEFAARSGDYNIGGSTRQKLVTAYRERALLCALALYCHGPSSPKQVREWIHDANAAPLLRNNYYGWFARVRKGVYSLTPAGEAALEEYRHAVMHLASRLPWAAQWKESVADPEALKKPSVEAQGHSV